MKSKSAAISYLESQGHGFIPVRKKILLQFYIVSATVFFIEMTIFYFLLGDMVNPGWVILTHMGVVILLFLWTELLRRRKESISLALLLSSTVAVLGPLGVIGTLSALGFYKFPSNDYVESESLYEQLFKVPDEKLSTGYLSKPDADVLPFIDVLSFGSVEEKRTVIMLISRYFRPVFTRVLFHALKDDNPSVRVLAATAIAKIENSFMEKTIRLEARLDATFCDLQLLIELATHYDDYAFTGLLRQEDEQETRKKALDFYKAYLEQRPEDIRARVNISRLLLRENRLVEAMVHLEEVLDAGYNSQAMFFWYIECLYRLKRFAELRRFAAQHLEKFENSTGWPDELIDAVSLWSTS